MHIITKYINEKFKLPNDVFLKIIAVKGKKIILGFNAPNYKLIRENTVKLIRKSINDNVFTG